MKKGILISEEQALKITLAMDLNADGGVSMTELKTLAVQFCFSFFLAASVPSSLSLSLSP
jgi:hypothetical protein